MTLNVAVIGTGSFAREHIRAFRQVPEARVVYVAGSDLARAQSLAMLAPGARASDDIEAVLDDPSVDAVDVCNATPDHARWTIAAGHAGKHVHVDKPAALSIPSFDEMVEAVEGSGRILMVGQTARFQPVSTEVQHACATGEIGIPRLLHVSWLTGHVWPNGWRAWQFDITKSGGHPVHNGIHTVDLAVWLMQSRPIEVFARNFPSFAAEMPMPDSFQMQLRFENGSLAMLEHCYALRQPGATMRRIMLAGTEGTLMHDSADDTGLSSPGHPTPALSAEGALTIQLRHWVAAMRGDESLIVTTAEARTALATAIAAQRSLVAGRPMAIEHDGVAS